MKLYINVCIDILMVNLRVDWLRHAIWQFQFRKVFHSIFSLASWIFNVLRSNYVLLVGLVVYTQLFKFDFTLVIDCHDYRVNENKSFINIWVFCSFPYTYKFHLMDDNYFWGKKLWLTCVMLAGKFGRNLKTFDRKHFLVYGKR